MANAARIAVDVGNSRIKMGRFVSGEGPLPECQESLVFLVDDEAAWSDSLASWAKQLPGADGVVAGSNQPGVDRLIAAWPDEWPAPMVIRSSEGFPIRINVDEPRRVGLDRLLNAIAACQLREEQQSVVIVDCGTASTVDFVSRDGAFEGGAILPGFGLSARALNEYTDALPLVSFVELAEQVDDKPEAASGPAALGRNTRSAIQSGIFWGQVGAIRELVSRLCEPDGEPPLLILTGGGSSALAPFLSHAVHCPLLPLQGLVLVADSNAR
jgi:type III pantothenate kinase